MEIKVLLQALARPWFIEQSQASIYAAQLHDLIHLGKRMDAVPNQDNRNWYYEFNRVDANGTITRDGAVQLVKIEGPLMKYDTCGSMGMESLQQGIRSANADSSIFSIVLLIDSPGGTVDGTHNLSREIAACTKPVIAFVNGMMCSAAYWIGSSATEIVADDANNGYNATIGSIGTMCMWQDTTEADKAKGIKTNIVTATKSTLKTKAFQDIQAGDYTRLIKELDNLNETFLSAVQTNRAGKLNEDYPGVLNGETYDAKEALKAGLIDRVANLQYAIKRSLQLAKTIK